CVVKVLLRIDFNVATRSIDMSELLGGFDHFLKKQNLVGLLKDLCLSPGPPRELMAGAMIVLAKFGGARRREFGNANVFSVGFLGWNMAMDTSNTAAGDSHLFRIVRWMIGAVLVAGEPSRIDTQCHVILGGGQSPDDIGSEENIA